MSPRLFRARRVLWMPLGYDWRPASAGVRFCCEEMGLSVRLECDQHRDPFECADVALVYNEIFDEYGIPVRDGGASYLLISHCPWCGATLPESARDRWFDAVEAEGLDAGDEAGLPERFKSAEWRKSDEA